MTYIAPKARKNKFTCPHCGVVSHQTWIWRGWNSQFAARQSFHIDQKNNPIGTAKCAHCDKHSLWLDQTMLYPDIGNAPPPNPDLPKPITDIYLEAASISTKSPRGAAALLRLAVQLLCKELGEKGNNIDRDIAELVKKGLPERVQKALDIVRVTGNNAVHPGQIDVDDAEKVARLFELINVIVECTISSPKHISNIYSKLPEEAISNIEKRDNKNSS